MKPTFVIWSPLVMAAAMLPLAGCNDTELPTSMPVAMDGAFTIARPTLTYKAIIGAESFPLSLTVAQPNGRYIRAYGVRTPYEETVHVLESPLPMAISNGTVKLTMNPFIALPVAGEYPFQVWLINEKGEASNPVDQSILVQ